MGFFSRSLTRARLKKAYKRVEEFAAAEDYEAARAAVEPVLELLSDEPTAADALFALLREGSFRYEDAQELADLLLANTPDDTRMVAALGAIAEQLVDMRYLNEAAPAHPVFERLVRRLEQKWTEQRQSEQALWIASGLSTVARLAGRAHDKLAEAAAKRLTELEPESAARHYDLGLFYKTRARFEEGVRANRRALELYDDQADESALWNLGICATGAGDGETALRAWKQLGLDMTLGDSGLPEGNFAQCKVRLAQFPLAERGPERDALGPGGEETIWIERLSPCHGVVRSALVNDDIGVDFGDIVLLDGAPITHHRYDGRDVPVFPHLATLEHRRYQIYRFTGTQQHPGQLQALGRELPNESWIYVHDELFRIVCRECWENPEANHDHDVQADNQTIVSGKLCAPPSLPPDAFLAELDALMQPDEHTRILAPELARAAGDPARAESEKRRLAMIHDS